MKTWVRWMAAVLILLAGVAVTGGLLSMKETPLPAELPKAIPEIEVITAKVEEVRVKIPSQGTVEPMTVTKASSEVEGKVLRVAESFKVGGEFREGEVLLELDPTDAKAALAQAETALAEARVQLEQEKMRGEQAKRDWERVARPGQEASELVLRGPQRAAAEARVESAVAAVAKALRDLESTKLKAPYDGRLRQKLVDVGSRVARAGEMAEFYATERYEVRLPVPRQDAGFFELRGQEIELRESGGRGRTWKAVVDRTEGEIQRANRSIVVVARLGGRGPEAPLPGQFVQTEIEGNLLEGVVRVPRTALVSSGRAMVVDDEGRVTTREVKVVRTEKDHVLVSEGIRDGEALCVTALTVVIEGMQARVVMRDGQAAEGGERR